MTNQATTETVTLCCFVCRHGATAPLADFVADGWTGIKSDDTVDTVDIMETCCDVCSVEG